MPTLTSISARLRSENKEKLGRLAVSFDNKENLCEAIKIVNERLAALAKKGIYLKILEESET
jgi:phosphopantothenate synthetase